MKPSTFLTAGEASRATGKSVPTITRAIKKGKIKGDKDPSNGGYLIDPTSLFNHYPATDPALLGKGNATPQTQQGETPELAPALQSQIKLLERLIEEKDKAVETAEETAEHWRTEYQRTQNQLTDQRTEAEKAKAKLVEIEKAPKPEPKRRKLTFKERLFGGSVEEVA